jgi:hypothetical protein
MPGPRTIPFAPPEPPKETRIELPSVEDAAALLASEPAPEPPLLIEGILHQGLKAEVAGASKSMKSWLLLNIAVSVAAGVPWLGRFATARSRLFFLNLELPKWHFEKRLRMVTEALGIGLQPGFFNAWSLRGVDLSRDDVWNAVSSRIIESPAVSLVVADPLYKLFNESRGENETTGTTAIMKRFDLLAEQSGASPLFSHHFAKGSPANKEAIDRFSGSGVLARDPDVYITMTRHETQDAFTIEMSLRCLPPVEPFVIRWNPPIFELATDLDPRELRQPLGRRARYSVDDLVEELGNDNLKTAELQKRCSQEKGMSRAQFYLLLKQAEGKVLFKSKVDNTWEVIQEKSNKSRKSN